MPVEVIDARAPATGASAAPRAVLAPHCASWQSPQTRIVAAAFLHALAEYGRLGVDVDRTGLVMPVAPDDAWATEAMLADWGWPADQVSLVDGTAAAALAGTPLGDLEAPRDAIHFPGAGTIDPAHAVRTMLDHPAIALHRHSPIACIARDDGRWTATAEDGRSFTAEVLVLATGGLPPGTLADMPQALGASAAPSVPFDATRGQLSLLGFTDHPGLPRVAVSGNGYVMPPRDGTACVGATFEREELERPTSPRDDAINLGHAQRLLPALREAIPARAGAWAGLRCSVNDHCPVAGPAVAESSFRTAFERLAHGPLAARWPAVPAMPGLFLSLAHGSRGTSTALLAAELIADMVSGSPRCVGNGLLPALLPQRFLVRSLRTARA
jgi:tRNA 5-methylaminomethyl-2-thiouridine biosynthesis bifunctional protein